MGLTTVSDENIKRLHADPILIWKLESPDDPEIFEREYAETQPKPGFFARLMGKRQDVSDAPDLTPFVDGEGEEMDIDKSWNALHFLLTGTGMDGEFPENFLILGGDEVGDIDVGYGPARAIMANQVHMIHELLQSTSTEELMSRYDAEKMMAENVYPEIWTSGADAENREYTSEFYKELKQFIAAAASRNLGVVISTF